MILSPLQKYQKDLWETLNKTGQIETNLEILFNKGRGLGSTLAAVDGCKLRSATLVCHNAEFAEELRKQFKIKTTAATNKEFAHAPTGAYIVDSKVLDIIVKDYFRLRNQAELLLSLMKQKGIE